MPDTTPTLRDRIAAAIRAESSRVDDVALADAVLAVLPEPPARQVLGTTDQQVPCGCPHPVDEHSVYGCADDCGCEWMPPKTSAAPAPAEACTEHGAACHTREWQAPGAVTAAAPVDRAAVLREAADSLDQRASVLEELSSSDYSDESYAARELTEAAARLRRLADEAQQPATEAAPTVSTSYVLEHREPGADTWRRGVPGPGPVWTWEGRTKADQRLADARERYPHLEIRMLTVTTTVTEVPVADQPDTETEAAPLAVGDRYECRTRPRTVTVTRLWVDEYGAEAVAFEWRGGMSGAAHTVDMFHQLYRPAP